MTPTGPGRISRDARASRSGYSDWIYLENFDIDGVIVKSEHRDELRRRFGRTHSIGGGITMADDNKWIYLRGYASRYWHAEHNIDLSVQRAYAVQQFLISLGISNEHITGLDYVGEEWSNSEIEEDPQFRCVEVIGRYENIPPPPPRPTAIVDRFKIRAKTLAGDALGVLSEMLDLGPVEVTILLVQIANKRTNESRVYVYYGVAMTISISTPTISGASSEWGRWTNFSTRSNHHVSLTDFEGEAGFGSSGEANLGGHSYGNSLLRLNSSQLHGPDGWVTVTPRSIVLDVPAPLGFSGTLISLPISGRLRLLNY